MKIREAAVSFLDSVKIFSQISMTLSKELLKICVLTGLGIDIPKMTYR